LILTLVLERKLLAFDCGLVFLDLGARLVKGSLDDEYFFELRDEVAIMIN
jgi:hypothetical protein